MADIGIRLVTNDEGFTSAIEKAIENVNELDKAEKDLNDTIATTMKGAVDNTDQYNAELSKTSSKLKSSAAEQKRLSDEVKNSIRNYKVFGVSINDVSNLFKKAAASSKLLASGIGTGTKALKLFKLALISTGVGALVVAVGALFARFTQTKRGVEALSKASAALGAVVDVIIDQFSALGDTLVKIWNDPLKAIKSFSNSVISFIKNPIQESKKLIDSVVEGTKELVKEINEEAKAAAALQERKNRLADAERALRVETAKSRSIVKELNKIAEDTTKTTEERAAAAEKAIKIEQNLLANRIKNAKEEVDILKSKNALGESLAADLDAQAEAEAKLFELRTESAELQTTLQNKLNTITAEGIRKTLELQKAYDDLFGTIKDKLFEAELENSSPIEQINKQFKKDIEELENTRDRLVELAELSGGDINAVNDLIEKLKSELFDKLGDSIEALNGEFEDVKIDFGDVEITGEPVIPDSFFKKIDDFKGELIKGLGLTPEQGKIFEEQVSQTVNTIFNTISAGLGRQIEANKKYRNELAKNVSDLESKLEEERDLKEQGLANDFDLITRKLTTEKELQEKANIEAIELQKKKAAAELAQNVISQISNLTTAATSIFKSTGSIPFGLGVPLAIGFIASMYAAFKSFKAQATADIKLYKGAERIGDYFGQPAPGGQSDIPGRGNGYRIEGTNVRIGGDEFLSTERAAGDHLDFLNDLNKNPNKYDGVDIAAAVNVSKSLSAIGKSSRKLNKAGAIRAERAIEAAIMQGAAATVEAIKKRPHYLAHDGEQVKIEIGRREKRPF